MRKKKREESGLPLLVVIATRLQEAMQGLRAVRGDGEAFEVAYDEVRLALNRVVVEILSRHLSEVTVRFDPKQPQTWDDLKSVLEVIVSADVLKIPVPQLRSADRELAEKVRIKMSQSVLVLLEQGKLEELLGRTLEPLSENLEYMVCYPVANKFAHGEVGHFGPWWGPWEHIAELPMKQGELVAALKGQRYALETCQSITYYLLCGCIRRTAWGHADHDFQQAAGCRTCKPGYRSNPYPEDIIEVCAEHAETAFDLK